jgi:hypothetical protein
MNATDASAEMANRNRCVRKAVAAVHSWDTSGQVMATRRRLASLVSANHHPNCSSVENGGGSVSDNRGNSEPEAHSTWNVLRKDS